MQNIVSLDPYTKEIAKAKSNLTMLALTMKMKRVLELFGLVDGQKVIPEWNLTEAKNVGRSNAHTAKTQAEFEAQAEWTKNVDKEYFVDVNAIDSYTAFKPMLAHDFTKTPVTSGITQSN